MRVDCILIFYFSLILCIYFYKLLQIIVIYKRLVYLDVLPSIFLPYHFLIGLYGIQWLIA